jgi:predicted nucleotidyltransferase
MAARFDVDAELIAGFSRHHDLAELAIFGSALREDFGQESDVDILVTFKPGTRVSLFDLVDMGEELSELLGRHVDLVPKRGLKPQIRQAVLEISRVIYAEAAQAQSA